MGVIGCGDSSSSNGSNGGIDPNERCNVELCIESDELKGNCVREYNSCVDKGGNPENCIVGAVETCTV